MEKIACAVAVMLIGAFSLSGAIFNWNWYFENYKAQSIVKVFGRNGARIFYAVLGIVLIVLGLVVLLFGD